MDFEFDPVKSDANRVKHGIDFYTARALWSDERRLVVPARTTGEPRFGLIAQLEGRLWTCIYTVRGEKIRIISVRRSRNDETTRYNQR